MKRENPNRRLCATDFLVMGSFLLASVVLVPAGCHGGVDGRAPVPGSTPRAGGERAPAGTYDYVAFGVADTIPRVTGTLTFQDAISGFPCHIQGTWNLQAVGDPGNVGPQIGAGTLAGDADRDGNVSLNLNPRMADNNVFLTGRFVDGPHGSIEGRWSVSTIVGEVSHGGFRAVPRPQ